VKVSTIVKATQTLLRVLPIAFAFFFVSAPSQGATGSKVLESPLPLQSEIHSSTEVVVYAFVSARCPCSQAHEPVLKTLAQEFSGAASRSKVQFIGVHSNANETEAEGVNRWKTPPSALTLGFPVFRDAELKWADAFGAVKTPHVFVVDVKTKKLLYQGGVDDSSHPENAKHHFLKNVLQELSQGKTPEFRETRVLGCRIDRSLRS
jgi:hypothetical protein